MYDAHSFLLDSSLISMLPDNNCWPRRSRTLARPATISGIGFVSGADVVVRCVPEPSGGIYFVRTDLEDSSSSVPACCDQLLHNDRRTTLSAGDTTVEMTEHLLAALVGLGVDHCRVELSAGELPAMDGSSADFVRAILEAGFVDLEEPAQAWIPERTFLYEDPSASIALYPHEDRVLRISYELDYSNPGIGQQSLTIDVTPESFARELASARTFVLAEEVAFLQAAGIGSRSTAKDLLVYDSDGTIIDNDVRYSDECVRHKILDIVGDLALVGIPVFGHVVAKRSGHRHNVALAQAIRREALECTRQPERRAS